MKKKFVGVCCPKDTSGTNNFITNTDFYWCLPSIFEMIVKNDCLPMVIQYENQLVDDYLDSIDGLILTGDGDINPKFYGGKLQEEDKDMGFMADEKMEFQKSILEKILIKKEKKIPIFGICAGMQSINVAMGGTLIEDIPTELNTKINHKDGGGTKKISHYIEVIDKDSILYKITKKESFGVTSNHHQAIKKLADNFKITGLCTEDKIIEVIEYIGDNFCLGVQWHPERYATKEDEMLLTNFFNIVKNNI